MLKANFKKYLGGINMRIFRREKVNFQSKNLVICVMGQVSKKESYFETCLDERIEWRLQDLLERRILIRGRNRKFYEPDGSKAYYGGGNCYKRKVKRGDLVVMSSSAPIQYERLFEFTEEEKRTKTITLERINELENLFNSK